MKNKVIKVLLIGLLCFFYTGVSTFAVTCENNCTNAPDETTINNRIKVLDCTLRDGGYINEWNFGESNIAGIRDKLTKAKTDIIECGYYNPLAKSNKNKSVYNNLEQLDKNLSSGSEYCVLLRYKKGIEDHIPFCSFKHLNIIRISFQHGELDGALNLCEKLKQKGYKVSFQPADTPRYTFSELESMIEKVNKINPYAFYVVDTLGILQKDQLLEMFKIADKNLLPNIVFGFHSHNNLQSAFSNAKALAKVKSNRNLILDSSVFGMGRGAGNLCTELITKHLNEKYNYNYDLKPLYETFDDHLSKIYKSTPWGYSLPLFISAKYKCSPDYATFLNNHGLRLCDIEKIISKIPENKKSVFDGIYLCKYLQNFLKPSIN